MTPAEFWLMYDAKAGVEKVGSITVDDADRLLAHLEQEQEKWQKQNS